VQEQPKEAERPDRLREFIELNGFSHEAIGAEGIASDNILLFFRRGENNHGKQLGAIVFANSPQHVQTADARQVQIEKDECCSFLSARSVSTSSSWLSSTRRIGLFVTMRGLLALVLEA